MTFDDLEKMVATAIRGGEGRGDEPDKLTPLQRLERIEADVRKDVEARLQEGSGIIAFDRRVLLGAVDQLRAQVVEALARLTVAQSGMGHMSAATKVLLHDREEAQAELASLQVQLASEQGKVALFEKRQDLFERFQTLAVECITAADRVRRIAEPPCAVHDDCPECRAVVGYDAAHAAFTKWCDE
jgi:hypothetical protein